MSSSDTSGAAKTVLAAKLGQFARDYPDVKLEVTTDDSRVDLVSAGFDAGIQFGDYIAQDMVAVRVSPDLRPAIVGAPAYFASHPKPAAPRDVLQHQCIGFRHRGESEYRWAADILEVQVVKLRVQRAPLQAVGWSGRHPRGRRETRRIRLGGRVWRIVRTSAVHLSRSDVG